MKKVLTICILFSICILSAHAWTFLQDAQNRDPRLMLPKIINKKGRVQACIQDEYKQYTQQARNSDIQQYRDALMRRAKKTGTPLDRETYQAKMTAYETKYQAKFDDFKQMYYWTESALQQVYNEWFSGVRGYIRASGREQEFADVLNLLPNEVQFTFFNRPAAQDQALVSCDRNNSNTDIDLFLNLRQNNDNDNQYGTDRENMGTCSTQKRRNLITFEPSKKYSGPATDVLLHEAGHSLGLSEMYLNGNRYDSSIFNMDAFQKRDGSQVPSAMNDGFRIIGSVNETKRSRKVQCDDADGIINIIDHYYGQKMSKRRTDGWMSLCKNRKIAYAYGLPFAVTDEEIEAHNRFVANGYQGPNPFATKIEAVAGKATAVERELADKLQAQRQRALEEEAERQRKAVADSLATLKENARVEKEMAHMQRHEANIGEEYGKTCPVCHQEIDGTSATRIGIKGKHTVVHNACLSTYKAQGGIKNITDSKYIDKNN